MKQYSLEDFLSITIAFAPSFNADGTKLIYRSNATGTAQIYLADVAQDTSKQLTDYSHRIHAAVFSPTDPDAVLFVMDDGGDENYQLHLLNVVTGETTPLTNNPKVKHGFGGWSPDGTSVAYGSNERDGRYMDPCVIDIKTGESRRVADADGTFDVAGFSSNGTYVDIYKHTAITSNDIYLARADRSELRHLTPHTGVARYNHIAWRPDESGFFFSSDQDQDVASLWHYDCAKDSLAEVMPADWEIEEILVSPDGTSLAISHNVEGKSRITIYDANSLKPLHTLQLDDGVADGITWSPDSQSLAFDFDSSLSNSNIYLWDRQTEAIRQITTCPQGVPASALQSPELIHYKSFDGLEIPAYIYTVQNTGDPTPPAVLQIHGGPEAQYRPTFDPLIQYMAYHGFTVVVPNIRGSLGYGKAYEQLDNIEKRLDSIKDIAWLRDHLVAEKVATPDRVIVRGGSYGGYAVLACLTFHPELWAAGVSTVGISSLVTFLENTTPYRRGYREAEYGSLENDHELLETISPLNFVDMITAPLFMIHGKNDPRVPVTEAIQINDKLTELGREVELHIYDDEGHGLAKLKNRLDAYPKMIEFMSKVTRHK